MTGKFRTLGRIRYAVDDRYYCSFALLGYNLLVSVPQWVFPPGMKVDDPFFVKMVVPDIVLFDWQCLEFEDFEWKTGPAWNGVFDQIPEEGS